MDRLPQTSPTCYRVPREPSDQLAIKLLDVHGTIAAPSCVRLRVVLHDIVALQLVEGNAHQSGGVEEEVLSTFLLLDKAKTSVSDSCDCSL